MMRRLREHANTNMYIRPLIFVDKSFYMDDKRLKYRRITEANFHVSDK